MKKSSKIAVVGGTGKSGKYLVRELLNQEYHFKMLVRNPENFKIESSLVEPVYGDVSEYGTVRSLFDGCKAVISTLGSGIPPSKPTIFTTATRNIIRAMKESGLKRYIAITGLNVDTPLDKKGLMAKTGTEWMYANYPKSTIDRQKELQLLSESGLDWTLIRLPLIALTDDRRVIATNLEDCPGENIGATDLAKFLLGQLSDTTFIKKAPFLANV